MIWKVSFNLFMGIKALLNSKIQNKFFFQFVNSDIESFVSSFDGDKDVVEFKSEKCKLAAMVYIYKINNCGCYI